MVWINLILMDKGSVWIKIILCGYDNENTFIRSIPYPLTPLRDGMRRISRSTNRDAFDNGGFGINREG
jgi:hypothetical protein